MKRVSPRRRAESTGRDAGLRGGTAQPQAAAAREPAVPTCVGFDPAFSVGGTTYGVCL